MVLAASSPVFLNILQQAKHSHPMIYLKGVKHTHLALILDFMYNGEVNVFQNDLQDFLVTAKEFKMKGLTDEESNADNSEDQPDVIDVNKVQHNVNDIAEVERSQMNWSDSGHINDSFTMSIESSNGGMADSWNGMK